MKMSLFMLLFIEGMANIRRRLPLAAQPSASDLATGWQCTL